MTGIYLRKTPKFALNVLYIKNIYPTYISKYNLHSKKYINHLLLPNGEQWHCILVKKICIIKIITPKCFSCFYCLNCLHLLRTKATLNLIKIYEGRYFFVL